MTPDLPALRQALVEAVEAAGAIALADYVPGAHTRARVAWKEGGSPVTSADHAVDRFLQDRLGGAFGLAYHSEEQPSSWQGLARQKLALVIDPIDGTRDFLNGGQDWCIVAGVLLDGQPIAGAVHMPARGETLSAARGGGAFLNGAALTPAQPQARWRANGPAPALEAFRARYGHALAYAGSTPALAHRLLVPLRGGAEFALARAGGHDWDLVASSAILGECGAMVLTISGDCPKFDLLGQAHPPLIAASRKVFAEIEAFDLTDKA